jgi:hypothetical protein
MNTNPLKDIAFEDINDEYCYGNYGEFKVIMMKKNGYINATKMCQYISEQTGSKKKYNHWKENISARELINCVSTLSGIPDSALFIEPDIAVKLRGTYVHPKLIPHIASWASPEFAVKVADIVNKYINKKELEKKERLIKQKDDKIDELMKKVDLQTAKIDKLLGKNKRISKKLSVIKEQNQEITQQNEELIDKVDTVAEDRVVKTKASDDRHMFVVMKDSEADDRERYYAIRTKKRTMKPTIKRYMNVHPNAEILIEISYNPNSINLWDRIKETLHDKIRFKLNNFGLKKKYTEKELIEDIIDINKEKLEV